MNPVFAIALTVCLSGCAVTPPSGETALDRFAQIFPGRYDSHAQTVEERRRDVPDASRNYRRHSIFRRVALPAFGETVFLAHQYRDGDPAKVYRQRLYTLWEDGEGFVLRVHVPKDADTLAGAYRDPGLLAGLSPDDFTVWEGCDLYWTEEDGLFVGRLRPGACRFDSAAFGQEIVLEETLTLSEDRMTFADRGLGLDGAWLFGMRGQTPNISLKARPFLCEYQGRTAWLHDQGGRSDALGFDIQMERGERLTLRISGPGNGAVHADRDVQMLSTPLGDAALTCRHAPETLYTESP